MKLKLKTSSQAADGAPADAPLPAPGAGPKLALKFKPVAAPAGDSADGPGDAPKQKRKYTKKPKLDENGQPLPASRPGPKPKKRALEDGEERDPSKRKVKPTMKSLSSAYVDESDEDDEVAPARAPVALTQAARANSIKISLKKNTTGAGRPPAAILKVKGHGRPPMRPPGVGYDSEAEEAERDPAIENQFVLRMVPGPDNDLLRKAIEEKTIGKSISNGGPGVQFRFFDREGRKAMVTIQGRHYAATMVELPCVIESLKSWNKKDWVKSADVCQMLLVLGRVQSEEEAKKYTRPREIEPDSHRYPHGLTPPMRWVRKRRFRPRKSYLDVERIETSVEELLALDEGAEDVQFGQIDSDDESSEAESDNEDAQGEDEDMPDADYAETPMELADEAELMAMFHDELEGDQIEVEANGDVNVDDLFNGNNEIEVETPVTAGAREVAMHALSQNGNIVIEPGSAASTPAAATSPDDDDEDDDDDDDDDDDEDDPEAAERQREREEILEQIRLLDTAIQQNITQRDATNNMLFKKRVISRLDGLIGDRRVKLGRLGISEEEWTGE
ncbi:hypothetical protein DPSP01_008242 [Paraphaeosphaeria sporulosa]|uniref:TAFII55 protein conserved region domain-containing protein n=1 Tax=Paraphaeosphaeria sporulosa TaxID=1460663 RepID=A0A177BXQ4_9PLEO|nr:uncharacterized protein CC84DRAFT_1200301 [Paraphaeosphaeria sporulosa]OAF99109.1 hypothetical protein CC84DRAFT_1200301 [Paraphaeosphaeria sporulosa]